MHVERLQLRGSDWARYFAPVAFCVYLAAICIALIITSAFLHNLRETLAVSAAAAFGLLLSGALGAGVLGMQLHELRYLPLATAFDSVVNFERVLLLARDLGWQLVSEQPGQRLDFRTADSMLQEGERVVVQFRDRQVLVACICDPGVGFSLVGRRRCQHNREQVERAVLTLPP
jgi:hypothetical protein